jgi:glycosyltransferase involved in cell wall biosynthesis
MIKKSRLFYLDDIPTPYRLSTQRRLAATWGTEFKIAYCATSEPGRNWSLDFSGLDVEFLAGFQFRLPRQVNPFSFKFNVSVLRSIRAYCPDIVIVSGYVHPTVHLAARWCRQHQIPYAIASESTARSSVNAGLKWYLKKQVVFSMISGMSFGLPTGKEAADYLRTLGAGAAPMYYFPNTTDTTRTKAEAEKAKTEGQRLRVELGIMEASKIVLFVGRMIDAKRPKDLLAAFGRLDRRIGANLVFVGDGPLLSELKSLSGGDQRVVFAGWTENYQKTLALMAISSVLVLPSQNEPWGAVVNECMAMGTPVIASDRVGAAIELLEHGVNGLIYPVGDICTLERLIELLLQDDDVQVRMGKAAQYAATEKGIDYAVANFLDGVDYALSTPLKRVETTVAATAREN